MNKAGRRVLVVDDMASIRSVVMALLKSAGYEAFGAGNGQAALDLLSKKQFDLVLTDQNMPRMDGTSLTRKLRETSQYRSTPILILTGEQGSAKSTTAKVLRSLIDPASPMARSAPQSEQDLVIAAKHNHVMAFDNLSTVKPALADALCRIATGGGFGTRKLHSDSDEVLFTVSGGWTARSA